MQKKAILVPTPGQTEQEYLAKYLLEKQYFYTENQENFSIKNAIEKANAFAFKKPDLKMDEYKKTVDEFVAYLKSWEIKIKIAIISCFTAILLEKNLRDLNNGFLNRNKCINSGQYSNTAFHLLI